MEYQLEKWRRQVWESETRWYVVALQQNLFGQWVITKSWGGKARRGGQTKDEDFADYEAALQRIEVIAQRRKAHGYRECRAA